MSYKFNNSKQKNLYNTKSTELIRSSMSIPLSNYHDNSSMISCICQQKVGSIQVGKLIKCEKCMLQQHEVCMGQNIKLTPYYCPKCLLWCIDPYNEPLRVLCPPQKIMTGNGTSQKKFNIEANTMNSIKMANGALQVQIRCCRLDGDPYEHSWPKHGWLKYNNKQLMPLTQPPENTSARKRKDEPFNVTTLATTGSNTVEIIQYNDSDVYAGIVYLVKKKSIDQYTEDIKKNNVEDVLTCTKRIKKILDINYDEICLVDQFRICSLKCPIVFSLIKTPVRGKQCTHLDCFSLESFALVNETTKTKKWRCPICGLKSQEVIVDEYWLQVIESAKKIEDAEEVEIHPDTGYRVITFKESKSRGLGKLQAVMATANKKDMSRQEKLQPKLPKEEINNKRKYNNEIENKNGYSKNKKMNINEAQDNQEINNSVIHQNNNTKSTYNNSDNRINKTTDNIKSNYMQRNENNDTKKQNMNNKNYQVQRNVGKNKENAISLDD